MSSLLNDIKSLYYRKDLVMRLILVNVTIYVISLLFFVFTLLLQIPNVLDAFNAEYLMLHSNLNHLAFHPWTLVSYMFLHSGVFHVLFNMLVLYWFGNLFVEYLGTKKFIYNYFLSGIFGGLFYVLCYNIFPYFNDTVAYSKALGASAAVMGIVFGAATLLPDYTIVLAIFGPIRLKYIAFFYLILDLVGISGSNSGGHLAHIGGALFGFLFIQQLKKGNDLSKFPSKIIDGISSIFKKKKLKVVYKNSNASSKSNTSVSQAEVDRILDKISKSGYENLTSKEKEILFKAGQQ